jgi:hypothetical protein
MLGESAGAQDEVECNQGMFTTAGVRGEREDPTYRSLKEHGEQQAQMCLMDQKSWGAAWGRGSWQKTQKVEGSRQWRLWLQDQGT